MDAIRSETNPDRHEPPSVPASRRDETADLPGASSRRVSGVTWSKEQDARLSALWLAGKSASVIAAEMHCSRNAVIGRVHRLKLVRHGFGPSMWKQWPTEKVVARKKRRVTVRATARRAGYSAAPARRPKPALSPVALEAIAEPLTTIMARKPGECAWIHGEPNGPATLMCGRPVLRPSSSYCPGHHAMAWTERQPERREPKRTAPPLPAALTLTRWS